MSSFVEFSSRLRELFPSQIVAGLRVKVIEQYIIDRIEEGENFEMLVVPFAVELANIEEEDELRHMEGIEVKSRASSTFWLEATPQQILEILSRFKISQMQLFTL